MSPIWSRSDPFVKLHDLGESDSGDMNFVCDLLSAIAVDEMIAVDIPHHVYKGQLAPNVPVWVSTLAVAAGLVTRPCTSMSGKG